MTKKILKKFSTVRMQLVASVFVAIAPALALTFLVNQTWFWEFAPGWLRRYALDVPWTSFAVGLLALFAAWFGGEHFILRQVRALSEAAQRFAKGDLNARTGLEPTEDEFGQLAKVFDSMAASLQQRINEREKAEKILLNRALQQTAIAALGQLALTENDMAPLLNQATLLVAHTLELEYSAIWERLPDGQLLLQAGAGWKRGCVGETQIPGDNHSQIGLTLNSGEMIVIRGFKTETQFAVPPLFAEHGISSGVTVAIPTRGRPFGVIGAHATQRRDFTPDEMQFLMAVATVLGMAVERRRADAEIEKVASFAKLNPAATMEFSENGTISYFNDAAQQLALSVRKKHPRDILPPEINDIIHDCLTTGRSKVRLETEMNDRTFSWLVSSRAAEPRGALLRGRHHRPVEPGGTTATITKNGIGRPVGRRGGARFQQYVDHHPGTFQRVARQADTASGRAGSASGRLFCRGTRRGPDPPTVDVQP